MANWQFVKVRFEDEEALIVSQFGEVKIPIMVLFREDIEALNREWEEEMMKPSETVRAKPSSGRLLFFGVE